MSSLNSINSMKARYGYDQLTNWGITGKEFDNTSADKVNVRGKDSLVYANSLLRIREDKLRSMKRALYNSYQSAVIQFDKDDRVETEIPGEEGEESIIKKQGFHFRCLINHDKLKVDYEDKVLSIPFREVPVEYERDQSLSIEEKMVDTGTSGRFLDEVGNPVLDKHGEEIYQYRVKPGDTFKWVSGNEGYMPDSYWIIFLQYSEQTAYFRGQIRKADDLIEVVPIGEDGSQGDPILYHGWSTGPNEDEDIWNVKKGVVWNDLYYSKLLYITKDETTEAFFKRFDRIVVNGQTWEVVGYNGNYGSSSKNVEGGMIRVALKETYTSTDQVIKQMEHAEKVAKASGQIIGPSAVQSYDIVTYKYITDNQDQSTFNWLIEEGAPIKVRSQKETQIKLEIGQVTSEVSFKLKYGEKELLITVKPFK